MKWILMLPVLILILSCSTEKKDTETITQMPADIYREKLQEDYIPYTLEIPAKDTTVFVKSWNSCALPSPRLLSSLNSGSRKFVYLIDRNNQGTLAIFGLGNLKLGKKEKIAVIDYVEYKDTLCSKGTESTEPEYIRLAAGVRLVLHIKQKENQVRADLPSQVAAATEFGLAETTFTIETLGFKNENTRRIFSGLGEKFDVEAYVRIMGAVGEVMRIMQEDMTVHPVKIPHQRDTLSGV